MSESADDTMGFFRKPGKSIVHLVKPETPDGPYSHTAICGVSATKEIPVARHAYGNDGEKVFTGMSAMVIKSVEGWMPSFPPDGVKYKLCKKCERKLKNANT